MLRPAEERRVSDAFQSQVQDQGGAQADSKVGVLPWRSERLRLQNEKKEENSASKCALPTTMQQNSVNAGALIGSIGNNWPRRCTSCLNRIRSDRPPGDSPSLMSNGQVLPQGHRQYLLLPSSPSQGSSVAGCGPRDNAGASIATGSSSQPFRQPLCQDLLPENEAPVPLNCEAPVFTPRSRRSGFRTPSGWASVPGAYLPAPGPVSQSSSFSLQGGRLYIPQNRRAFHQKDRKKKKDRIVLQQKLSLLTVSMITTVWVLLVTNLVL